MRRADRLFRLVDLLRRRRRQTAAQLAAALEVSVRTVYRDLADLAASGLPLRAEAGQGYTLEDGYDLPPLMFTAAELEALEMGARMIATWGDSDLRAQATAALARIRAVLPHTLRGRDALPFHTPDAFVPEALWAPLPEIRRALREQRKLAFRYTNEQGATVDRTVRPLAVNFWGHTWTLCAWCEFRDDFRHFRLDRMRDWQLLDAQFQPEPGKTLADLTRLYEQQQHGKQR